uniref:Uncharacterized protein n=1 Tax=uncultured prokaryote TaxID=198431 RepID=A0A0H5Q2P7_9ZZZZ|nr:hypothetical protein [uncultured prokaryote]
MLRVRTVFTGPPGTPWLSTMYFDSSDGGDAPAATARVADFWDACAVKIFTSVNITVQPEVAILNSAGELTGIAAGTVHNVSGTGSGDPLPWATQGLIIWDTNVFTDGRQVIGKTYVPGLTEGNATGGVLNGTGQSALLGAATGLLASDSPAFAVFSRKHSTINDVVAGRVDTQFAVLRSRRD